MIFEHVEGMDYIELQLSYAEYKAIKDYGACQEFDRVAKPSLNVFIRLTNQNDED